MFGRILFVIALLTSVSPVPLLAQGPNSATDVTRSEIEAVLNSPEGGVDRQVKVVDIGPSNLC